LDALISFDFKKIKAALDEELVIMNKEIERVKVLVA
jgi:hypothetical protein